MLTAIKCPYCGRGETPDMVGIVIQCAHCGGKYYAVIEYAYYGLHRIDKIAEFSAEPTPEIETNDKDAAPAEAPEETLSTTASEPRKWTTKGRYSLKMTLTPEQIAAVDEKLTKESKTRTWLKGELDNDAVVLRSLKGEPATIYKLNKILLWADLPILTESGELTGTAKPQITAALAESDILRIKDKEWRDFTLQEFWVGNLELAREMLNARNFVDAMKIRKDYRKGLL